MPPSSVVLHLGVNANAEVAETKEPTKVATGAKTNVEAETKKAKEAPAVQPTEMATHHANLQNLFSRVLKQMCEEKVITPEKSASWQATLNTIKETPEEVVIVLGLPGQGKSTLISALTGFRLPRSGKSKASACQVELTSTGDASREFLVSVQCIPPDAWVDLRTTLASRILNKDKDNAANTTESKDILWSLYPTKLKKSNANSPEYMAFIEELADGKFCDPILDVISGLQAPRRFASKPEAEDFVKNLASYLTPSSTDLIVPSWPYLLAWPVVQSISIQGPLALKPHVWIVDSPGFGDSCSIVKERAKLLMQGRYVSCAWLVTQARIDANSKSEDFTPFFNLACQAKVDGWSFEIVKTNVGEDDLNPQEAMEMKFFMREQLHRLFQGYQNSDIAPDRRAWFEAQFQQIEVHQSQTTNDMATIALRNILNQKADEVARKKTEASEMLASFFHECVQALSIHIAPIPDNVEEQFVKCEDMLTQLQYTASDRYSHADSVVLVQSVTSMFMQTPSEAKTSRLVDLLNGTGARSVTLVRNVFNHFKDMHKRTMECIMREASVGGTFRSQARGVLWVADLFSPIERAILPAIEGQWNYLFDVILPKFETVLWDLLRKATDEVFGLLKSHNLPHDEKWYQSTFQAAQEQFQRDISQLRAYLGNDLRECLDQTLQTLYRAHYITNSGYYSYNALETLYSSVQNINLHPLKDILLSRLQSLGKVAERSVEDILDLLKTLKNPLVPVLNEQQLPSAARIGVYSRASEQLKKNNDLCAVLEGLVIDYDQKEEVPRTVGRFSTAAQHAAQSVYDSHLRFEFKHKLQGIYATPDDNPYAGVNRPNHGLAHVMRQAFYVPFVFEFLDSLPDSNKYTYHLPSPERILTIQLKLLFAGCGRQNEAGGAHQFPEIANFWSNSSKALCSYLAQNVKMETWRCKVTPDMSVPSLIWTDCSCRPKCAMILNICHMLDSMRWRADFNSTAIHPALHQDHPLVQFALKCVIATGDRVLGMNQARGRDDALFQQCSTNVQFCLQKLLGIAPPNPAPVPMFRTCHFKLYYDAVENFPQPELDSYMGLVKVFGSEQNVVATDVAKFVAELQRKLQAEQDLRNPEETLWTADCRLPHKGGWVEFCWILNHFLRLDPACDEQACKAIPFSCIGHTLARFCRQLNKVLVQRFAAFEPPSTVYRGSCMPRAILAWFRSKVRFRAPPYLPTTSDRATARKFAERAFQNTLQKDPGSDIVQVLWVITIPKSCANGDFASSGLAEHEFLFVPYSVFTVANVRTLDAAFMEISLMANDNKDKVADEELPLSAWN